jgi:hypothetical protein
MSVDHGEVATPGALRRIEAFAAAWWLALAVAFAAADRGPALVSLTAAAAASILAFRSLEGVVRRLRAASDGALAAGGQGWLLARWFLLLVVLVAVITLASHDVLALVAGLTVTPLGLMTEAGVELVGIWIRKEP